MHFMHLLWVGGHIIGFFHQPSVIVCSVMTIFGISIIYVFYRVFQNDLFGDGSGDNDNVRNI
jgi:hypothetical protein